MRRIGVTATRTGLTDPQVTSLVQLLRDAIAVSRLKLQNVEIHHGDCIGGDATIDAVALHMRARRVARPGPGKYRAWCVADDIRPGKGFLERDRDIVDETVELWVFPKEDFELLRGTRGSGTWYTYHYAWDQGRPIKIVWPDGRVEERQTT
jgi:hypothetical protein